MRKANDFQLKALQLEFLRRHRGLLRTRTPYDVGIDRRLRPGDLDVTPDA